MGIYLSELSTMCGQILTVDLLEESWCFAQQKLIFKSWVMSGWLPIRIEQLIGIDLPFLVWQESLHTPETWNNIPLENNLIKVYAAYMVDK